MRRRLIIRLHRRCNLNIHYQTLLTSLVVFDDISISILIIYERV
jgi:hypothetical protein